ncbi:fructosamine kinase family protein [Demequina sp. SYSU T00039]|uniref:Fructosamine kinase family protein n=1 Tax=Demequina lignilytica TaxID=3051663 RepID=A0AAW7M2B7_9MICO|nr:MULTISPECIES: fructosamine kinase family protein [unclassified Demequina]MDN4478403.1 fructosamine kinase family protein [Demequina sp. SYSU T00039-1]MDN4487090.1 fructosamine kinase family protein [Demequina sp. SYSU T00039]MDN4489801.1 fructosamine kinase family protein [Demequina sp. SYSU T00068]
MDTHLKTDPGAPSGFYEAEAAGLAWLATAPGGARTVTVVEVAPGRIVLERIVPARPSPAAAHAFGGALARTHAAGAHAFGARPAGWDGPLFIGSREMPTTAADSWGAFYAEARVLPFLAPALAAGYLHDGEARIVRDACDLIASGAFDDPAPPARIHGDLWSGNVLWSPDGVVLIDPAAHGGHPETDLAMLALFGLPFLDDAVAGYAEAAPLRAGWRSRVPVHQLHPLAVHAAGHGRAYGAALADAARATLALRDA